MTETLTESFCERCGTRYEFSTATRLNPLRKTRGLFGGLKNYLTSQDAFSDSIGDAIRGEEGVLATAQLEAFHEAFNFCIDCRQYTCLNCWNDDAGRCRTCVPIPGTDDLVERLVASVAPDQPGTIAEALMTDEDLQRRLGRDEKWPMSDMPAAEATNGHVAEPWPVTQEITAPVAPAGFVGADGFVYDTAEQAAAVASQLEQQPEPEPEVVAASVEPVAADAEPTWVAAELEPEPVAAEAEPALPPLHVVAWDDDATFDVEPEPEPMVAEVEPEPEQAPVGTTAQIWPEPEQAVAELPTEPEPVAAEAEPAPPEAVEPPRLAPISETIVRFPRPSPPTQAPEPIAAVDDSPEVAARRAQLDELGLGDGSDLTEQSPAVLPYRSRGAAITPAELAARSTFWEASAREVAGAVGNIGLQNCGHCGLALSANARFCRRCGTQQARSA